MVKRFVTKRVEIEAMRWTGDNAAELDHWTLGKFQELHPDDRAASEDPEATGEIYDKLHSTWILVLPGQWIVKGVKNEFYPCDDETFHWKYDEVVPNNLGATVEQFEAVG